MFFVREAKSGKVTTKNKKKNCLEGGVLVQMQLYSMEIKFYCGFGDSSFGETAEGGTA